MADERPVRFEDVCMDYAVPRTDPGYLRLVPDVATDADAFDQHYRDVEAAWHEMATGKLRPGNSMLIDTELVMDDEIFGAMQAHADNTHAIIREDLNTSTHTLTMEMGIDVMATPDPTGAHKNARIYRVGIPDKDSTDDKLDNFKTLEMFGEPSAEHLRLALDLVQSGVITVLGSTDEARRISVQRDFKSISERVAEALQGVPKDKIIDWLIMREVKLIDIAFDLMPTIQRYSGSLHDTLSSKTGGSEILSRRMAQYCFRVYDPLSQSYNSPAMTSASGYHSQDRLEIGIATDVVETNDYSGLFGTVWHEGLHASGSKSYEVHDENEGSKLKLVANGLTVIKDEKRVGSAAEEGMADFLTTSLIQGQFGRIETGAYPQESKVMLGWCAVDKEVGAALTEFKWQGVESPEKLHELEGLAEEFDNHLANYRAAIAATE